MRSFISLEGDAPPGVAGLCFFDQITFFKDQGEFWQQHGNLEEAIGALPVEDQEKIRAEIQPILDTKGIIAATELVPQP